MVARDKTRDVWKWLKGLVLNNLWLKIISLLMAFTLWFLFTGGPKNEEWVTVRLTVAVPEGWTLVSRSDDEVELRLRGRDDQIQKLLNPTNINELVSVLIDSSMIAKSTGRQQIGIDTSNVSLPIGVEVIDIKPNTVTLDVDHLVENVEKRVEIRSITIEPEKYYTYDGKPIWNESTIVEVTGPEERVDAIGTVKADVVYRVNDPVNDLGIKEAKGILDRESPLRYNINEVSVRLNVVAIQDEHPFDNVDRGFFTYGSLNGFEIEIRPRTLRFKVIGPLKWVENLKQAVADNELRIVIPESVVRPNWTFADLVVTWDMLNPVAEIGPARVVAVEGNPDGSEKPLSIKVRVRPRRESGE